ncbi:hypothetical protein MMC12_003432 [Toensbergia leucococca]|nr:hypothetical protein [Toensbergia leucococca]
MSESLLPTLDASLFLHGTDEQRKEFSSKLVFEMLDHACVKLVNHGIEDHVVEELFGWSKRFFELPMEEKIKIENVPNVDPQRGYSSFGVENSAGLLAEKEGKDPDAKEHFDQGRVDNPEFPNQFPEETEANGMKGFRVFMEKYYDTCQKLGVELMRAIEMGLGIPRDSLAEKVMKSDSELRFNYFPELELKRVTAGTSARIWPHTDFCVLTMLFQDQIGGLEMEDQKKPGNFYPVKRNSTTEMLINGGESLQRLTNNVIRAGLHRVVGPPQTQNEAGDEVIPKRYSVPFFVQANHYSSVGPLPYFVDENRPAAYSDITTMQFTQERTANVY